MFSFYSKIGEEQSAEDAEDGPPELLVTDLFIWGQYWLIRYQHFVSID